MTKFFTAFKTFIIAHKILSGILLVVLSYGGYYEYGKLTSTAGETRYVMSTASKGTIISSVSGTGQVSTSNQVDLKPKVSGSITAVPVSEGHALA